MRKYFAIFVKNLSEIGQLNTSFSSLMGFLHREKEDSLPLLLEGMTGPGALSCSLALRSFSRYLLAAQLEDPNEN